MRYRHTVELNLFDISRMDNAVQLLPHSLDHDNDSGDFHSAAGRTGAGSHDHQNKKDTFTEFRPFVKVIRRIAGRSYDRTDLKSRMAYGLFHR